MEVIVGKKDKKERRISRLLNTKGKIIRPQEWEHLIPAKKSTAGYTPVLVETDYGWNMQLVKENRIEKRKELKAYAA